MGENCGPFSIVRVKAWDSSTSLWQTLYTGEANPEMFKWYKDTNQYNKFIPSSFCQTTFATSILRFELDTYQSNDYNELDYVKVVGATELKAGVMHADVTTQTAMVMFVPDADFTGHDSFQFKGCDCAYDSGRTSEAATVSISVGGVNDAPTVAQSISVVAECAPDIADEITLQASDVDANTSITFHIVALPTNAALYDGVSGLITSDLLPASVSGATVSLIADYSAVTEPFSGFEFTFTATDEAGSASPVGSVAVICSATLCNAGLYFDVETLACAECPVGTFATDTAIRGSCEDCAVGTFAPNTGSHTCGSCDNGQIALDHGSASCSPCPSGATCINTSSLTVNEGNWRTGGDSYDIWPCPLVGACKRSSGSGDICNDGFTSVQCGVCDDDYFYSPRVHSCVICADSGSGEQLWVFILIMLAVGACTILSALKGRNVINARRWLRDTVWDMSKFKVCESLLLKRNLDRIIIGLSTSFVFCRS